MSIFGKPLEEKKENEYGVKILFLHGLEGNPEGSKSMHLKEKWCASSAPIRTQTVVEARDQCSGNWGNLDQKTIDGALKTPFKDALDAVNYFNPDIIVGSSLGAALLYKLYANKNFSGAGVFLAPAIPHLLSTEEISAGAERIKNSSTVWVLGEADTIVSNSDNARIAKLVQGNLIYSPEDSHRLHKALSSGLIDAAVLTVIEEQNGR